MQARVDNIESWTKKLGKLIPFHTASMELVRYDTQKMQNPEISGIEYQQGTLQGYEIREYLLDKFNRSCAYCEKTDIPLEVEHVLAKSRGGTDRVSNLAMACRKCNEEKDNLLLSEWVEKLKKKRDNRSKTILKKISTIEKRCKKTLKDSAIVNVTRWKLYELLVRLFEKDFVEVGSGALTKMNRIQRCLEKEHYYDAVCVGSSTPNNLYFQTNDVLQIKAKGRGSRYRSATDKYGFPNRFMPKNKIIHGFISGDMIKIKLPKGKYKGVHYGFISMRSIGFCNVKGVKGNKVVQGGNSKYATKIQSFDGYAYGIKNINLKTAIPNHT